MQSPASVTVIVLAWNQVDTTLACLRSLMATRSADLYLDILLVDNGSTDGTAETIRERFSHVKVLRNSENMGYAGGNNVGIRYALSDGADYLCILNNDVAVAPEFLVPLLGVLHKEGVGIVTPMVCEMENRGTIWALGGAVERRTGVVQRLHAGEPVGRMEDAEAFQVDVASGAAMLAKREVFEDIGLLDEAYYLYFEETDWCLRAREAGYRIFAVPSSVVWHQVSGTLGQTSPVVDYYMLRNHLRFIAKHWCGLRRWSLLGRTVARNLLTIAAYTAKPRGRERLHPRNARVLALQDAILGRWGKTGPDVEAACSGQG